MSSLVIATNVASLNSHRDLKGVSESWLKLRRNFKWLHNQQSQRQRGRPSHLRENENQVKGLNMAFKNASDGEYLIQTIENVFKKRMKC